MKKGLILEGGAMRGLYTAGVMDVLMENGIEFDGAIGVSAGAVFGCNYKSKQIGRVLRYNKTYCRDSRYSGLGNLLKTGDLYGAEFCYEVLPNELDIFDVKTYRENPMDFYVVATDVHTGKAVYHNCVKGDQEDITWMRASASMPLVSRVVYVGGYELLDGGIADSIPVNYFKKLGYEKNVVVLTQVEGYRKKKSKLGAAMKLLMKKYPAIGRKMELRHIEYNCTLSQLEEMEKKGSVFILRPSELVKVGKVEKDPEKLQALYDVGRKDAQAQLEKIKAFLNEQR